jgi:hypothetical protein
MGTNLRPQSFTRVALAALGGWLAAAAPAHAAVTAIFEAAGVTIGNDAVECADQGTYRTCESDALTERVLSHPALQPGERVPIDFKLYLPPAPASGPDGLYPLVIFIHGWGNSRTAPGGGLESEYVPYAQGGYAVLTYNERAWNASCGAQQQANAECMGRWNHLADIRYEVRDAQYLAGLLADELSDGGTPLVDPAKIGVTGVSYGGGQSTMLASLRNRVVKLDGTTNTQPWTSPAGKPMQIAAAAPFWAWTDLAYSLLPNGRTLDYAVNNAYRGPLGNAPFGVSKTSYVSGLYALGHTASVYAPPGQDPDLNTWNALIDAGEPYQNATLGPIATAVTTWRSGYYWIDPAVQPAPTLFNSGWSDDIFPVNEPVRWIQRAKYLHPNLVAELVASDYGHARASGADAAYAKSTARAWFDYYLKGIGSLPGPAVRVRTQGCAGGPSAAAYSANTWAGLPRGEVRLQGATGVLASVAGPSAASANAFDPIAGGDPCARVADDFVPAEISLDLPSATGAGYTVLGSPTLSFQALVTSADPASAEIAARLLDVDGSGNELLVSRGVFRPGDVQDIQVFQLAPMGFHIDAGHHLQLELLGNEAPTFRQSNLPFTINVNFLELRVPVAEPPNGGQIQSPAPVVLPTGYVPEPGSTALFASGGALVAMLARRRRTQ